MEQRFNKYFQQINSIVDQYIALGNLDYQEVENAYGKIDYIFNNKRRESLYNSIHKPLREMLKKIKDSSYHFKLYRNGKSNNISVVIEYILNLQDLIFKKEEKDCDGMHHLIIYNECFYEFDRLLEKFRSEIYNQKPEYRERNVVMEKTTLFHKIES